MADRPSPQAQAQFNLMMDVRDLGPEAGGDSQVDAIRRFVEFSYPGLGDKIQWPLLRTLEAGRIVKALRLGLQNLQEGKPFMRTSDLPFKDGIAWNQQQSRMLRVASRSPSHVFISCVFEVLVEVAPWLRVCQREQCRKFFLFGRPKQVYCSAQCAQRARMERFVAKKQPSA